MKMTPAQGDLVSIQVENERQAYDGGNKNMVSPNQYAFDEANAQLLKPTNVYNFETTTMSGIQKIMLYAAFAGVAYIIYKKYIK